MSARAANVKNRIPEILTVESDTTAAGPYRKTSNQTVDFGFVTLLTASVEDPITCTGASSILQVTAQLTNTGNVTLPDSSGPELVAQLPPTVTGDMLQRELVAMPSILNITPSARPQAFDLQLAGSGPAADLLATGIVKPLNMKLGQPCFAVGAVAGDVVNVSFDSKCNDPTVIAKLDTNPLAALYSAPVVRQKAVVSNPDTLKKLMI